MSKRALLVGINKFAGRPEWALRGCVNDSRSMNQLLGDLYGMEASSVRILNDDEATSRNLLDGLDWLLSDYDNDGSDVRLFHFASHGTQIAAEDLESEEDMLDEVIVPYDHDWNSPFSDNQLRERFDRIPDRASFVFVADCCHSGSINKAPGDVIERFVNPPEEMQEQVNRAILKQEERVNQWVEGRLQEELRDVPIPKRASARRGLRDRLKQLFYEEKNKGGAPGRHVLLAACRDDQTAADAYIDDDYRGAFTWSLVSTLRKSDGNMTYGELIEASRAKLAGTYTQIPQIDAPGELGNRPFLSPVG